MILGKHQKRNCERRNTEWITQSTASSCYVPSLPGCVSEGETVEEALGNIQEAIELYLEPVEDDLVIEETALVQEIEL
jgi:predicted RNase H-like HicB family nuclease